MMIVLENAMMMTGKFKGIVADVRLSNAPSLSFFRNIGYSARKKLSKPEKYKYGDTPTDRFRVVLYKDFPVINP